MRNPWGHIVLNDRVCILCGHSDNDLIESQGQNSEFRDCPACGKESFRRQIHAPSAVYMGNARAIDMIDAERAKCAAGHGNTSIRL
jgi:hypothetical protein